MKILIDAHIFDEKFQGTRTYLKGLYNALIPIAKDWEFYFTAYDLNNLRQEIINAENVHFIPLKSKNKFYRLSIDFPELIKKYKIEYAHFQYISPFVKNCKTIVTIHDILFREKRFEKYFPFKYKLINNTLFKRSAKQANILLTVSSYSQKKISEYYGISTNNIFITPNAVSEDFNRVSIPFDTIKEKYNVDKYILYVSRIEPRKNHLSLLKAYNELNLKDKGYKLVFIGVNDLVTKELEEYKNTYQKELEGVLWLKGIPFEELKCFYKNCSLFVFPSLAEGFGIPPLEAIIMERKILCSNATAMQDFNLPDHMYFNPTDKEELKKKMLSILSDDSGINTEVKTNLLQKYNWTTIAKEYYNLILSKSKK